MFFNQREFIEIYKELRTDIKMLDEIVRNHGSKFSLQERVSRLEQSSGEIIEVLKPFIENELPQIKQMLKNNDGIKSFWVTVASGVLTAFVTGFLTWHVNNIVQTQNQSYYHESREQNSQHFLQKEK